MNIFEINILITNFYASIFQIEGLIFRKTVVYAVNVWYVSHAWVGAV